MIPAQFEYTRASTLEEAIEALRQGGEDAKLLAGGHSLIPLLIDIGRLPGLGSVQREDGAFRIGALVRHAQLERSPELGLIARAAGTIADQQVRNRGTIGGSLAHGDPASDLPGVVLALEGTVTVQGPGGQRTIAASELFRDYLQTALEHDEVLTEIHVPAAEGYGFSYQKFNRRAEDWAMVAVSALVKRGADGSCEDVRVALTNMGATPLRASATEQALRGRPLEPDEIARAAAQAAEGTDPPADLNASADYKRHLARVLCERALREAAGIA